MNSGLLEECRQGMWDSAGKVLEALSYSCYQGERQKVEPGISNVEWILSPTTLSYRSAATGRGYRNSLPAFLSSQ